MPQTVFTLCSVPFSQVCADFCESLLSKPYLVLKAKYQNPKVDQDQQEIVNFLNRRKRLLPFRLYFDYLANVSKENQKRES